LIDFSPRFLKAFCHEFAVWGDAVKNLSDVHFGRVRLHWLFGLIVLIAVMPVFVLYFSRLQASRAEALAEARSQVYQFATRAADVYADITIKSRHVLETVAASASVRSKNRDCDGFFEWVQHLVVGQGTAPWITGLFLTDAKGQYICGTFMNGKTANVGDREYFKRMIESREFATSGILTGRYSHRMIIGAALPIYDEHGRQEKAVVLGADLYQLNVIASEANERFGGRLLVFNEQGDILANLPQGGENTYKYKFDKPMVIQELLKSDAPTLEVADQDGVRSIYGIKHLPHGQRVAIALSRDAILAPIERTFRSDLLFLLLVAAASATASLIVAEFAVLRGVRILKGAALRLKAGKMGVRVKQPKLVATELDDLAQTYNAMTAEFERLAYLDRLTGLPNRRYLERQINGHRGQDPNLRQAVLAIDLDGFKPVNDTYGHAMGDRVLTASARRIATVVDERGMLTRLGGDEFVAIIPLPKDGYREYARKIAEDIRDAMEKTLDVEGTPIDIGCSVGLAVVPDDATSLAGAVVVADSALYEAKRAGRNRVIDNAPLLASEAFSDIDEDHSRWLAAHTE
jgi:diguanylate cyclase (GGDEF)-like protein